MWDAAGQTATGLHAPPLLQGTPVHEAPLALPAAPEGEDIVFDYAATGLTLRRHPLALLREQLQRRGVATALQLRAVPHGRRVRACGIVTVRQRPGSADALLESIRWRSDHSDTVSSGSGVRPSRHARSISWAPS